MTMYVTHQWQCQCTDCVCVCIADLKVPPKIFKSIFLLVLFKPHSVKNVFILLMNFQLCTPRGYVPTGHSDMLARLCSYVCTNFLLSFDEIIRQTVKLFFANYCKYVYLWWTNSMVAGGL